ncbi:class II fumarate hydratase [Paratractidigestivibacter sp.]|uniref:class II fumarate hydratase n=1 Tax=Paratractidigestivibacter sp. TaxID=2847316 RepID=UPI002ABD29CA|nr:class II fumarate hydratase [Paratractidigestivibacter sp.]
MADQYRVEHDSMGEMRVPVDALWGAQTQRSHENFPIGGQTMPAEIIAAFAQLKKAAARANAELGRMDGASADMIAAAADEALAGKLDGNFPLVVWQTGSGTQSNMNMNEVLANRGNQIAAERGVELPRPLHPNDSVNMSQSSNDTFPTAMHIAAATALSDRLLPAIEQLAATFERLEEENAGIVKSGRTHLQDAVPISFSQEIFGWRGLLEASAEEIRASLPGLYRLALGGTAVGTGLNAPAGFDTAVAAQIASQTGLPFVTDPNKFRALSGKDAVVFAHGAVKALAANMMKIANDVRWLASGPRLGLGEITIPANEPGSSIMPGKVNPTQCEAVTMVAVQVMGNDATIGFAASQGNFELNVFMPVIAYNFLQSVGLLADAIASFDERCASGITANREKMHDNLHGSLMLVTALNPYIGYENAAKVAKKAYAEGTSLKEACVELGFLTAERFDEVFHPEQMV